MRNSWPVVLAKKQKSAAWRLMLFAASRSIDLGTDERKIITR